eukprot:gene10480-19191_t
MLQSFNICLLQMLPQSKEGIISAYSVIIALSFIMISAATFNGLILYVMATNSHLRTPSGMLILFMAITDLVTGIVSVPLAIARQAFVIADLAPPCFLHYLYMKMGSSFFCVTIFLLALLSFDRYLHAAFGAKTRSWKLARKYKFLYVTIMVFALGWIALIPLESLNKTVPNAIGLFVSICAIICVTFSHVKVCLLLRASCKIIPGRSMQVSADFRGQWLRRSVNTLIIIMAVFFICYIPRLIRVMLNILPEQGAYTELEKWSATSIYLNSAINPIIYIQRSRRVQLELKRYWKTVTRQLRE